MTPSPSGASVTPQPLPGSELCVHCGFCLQACPTYLAVDDENDSPRGRIVLMKALAAGELTLDDPDAQLHLDACLGCRACETACPSGVPYGQLLETIRERMAVRRPLPLTAQVILFVFGRPALLAAAMFGARVLRGLGVAALLARLPGSGGFAMAMLASSHRPTADRRRRYVPLGDESRESVAFLRGCVMEGLFGPANRATERTLTANGYRLTPAPGLRCCGALHAHAGDGPTARSLARTNIQAFEQSGAEFMAVNSAGCGATMKAYAHLLRDDSAWHGRAAVFQARVRDVSELLAVAGPERGGPIPIRVAYDAPCHLLHGQRVATAPLAVLGAIPSLELVLLEGAEQCCGSAGIYNLVAPAMSSRVLAPKLANIAASGASVIATGNPGCLMQIGAGLMRARREGGVPMVLHPVELLDASYARRQSL